MVSPLGTVPLQKSEKTGEMEKLEPLQHKLGKPTDNSWKTSQHLVALGASLGAMATGTTIGWVAPYSYKMHNYNNFYVTDEELNRIKWMAFLGGATLCFPITFIMNKIGRRTTMLLLVIPFTIGWALITWAQNVTMLILGIFITGMAGGAFCVTTPVYISEIAQDSIRGTLASYFQAMYTMGFYFALYVRALTTVSVLNIACACIPLLSGVVFYFMPETPSFLVAQNKHNEARRTLLFLKGSEYEADVELDKLKRNAENSKNYPVSIKTAITKKSTRHSIAICLALIFFQQLFGYKMFFASSFSYTNRIVSFTIAATVGTFITTVTVDRFGRRILLLASLLIMCFCSVAFEILEHFNENSRIVIVLLVLDLMLLTIAFHIGFGPLLWIAVSDLCQIDGRFIVVSTTGTFHFLMSAINLFLTYRYYNGQFHASLMVSISFLAFLLVFFVFPDTKGKSTDEIERIVGGDDHAKVPPNKL